MDKPNAQEFEIMLQEALEDAEVQRIASQIALEGLTAFLAIKDEIVDTAPL